MANNKIEIRVSNNDVTVEENRNVEGYAILFNTPSDGLDWVEIIHDGAVTNETIANSDVFAKLNHDDGKVLARSKFGKGSLVLGVDEKGLKYLFEAPNTETGNELLEYLKRGDITASSFAFTIDHTDPNAERWHKENGVLYRDIYKINRLYDVSPVFQPAYSLTTVSARGQEMKKTADELQNLYDNLIKQINEKIYCNE